MWDTSSDETLPQTSTQTTMDQRIFHAHTTFRDLARGCFYRCLKNARKLFHYPRSLSLKSSCSCTRIVSNGQSVGWLSTKIFAQDTFGVRMLIHVLQRCLSMVSADQSVRSSFCHFTQSLRGESYSTKDLHKNTEEIKSSSCWLALNWMIWRFVLLSQCKIDAFESLR